MTLHDELSELYARVPRGMRLGLDAMQEAASRFGHPERSFAAVHVAGTNGKGSTTSMVETIARSHGLRTGRYTSPHLARFAERIAIDGEPLQDEALVDVLHVANRGAPELSFFETATLAAFIAFQRARVDLAVIEVGIGGRLDATNILPPPRATAITRIALDHTDRLGPTLEHIAREKAGIAKAGTPLVIGAMSESPLREIVAVASAVGAPIVVAPPDPLEHHVALRGAHQRENARVAIQVARCLSLPDESIRKGLAGTRWPGRLERIADQSGSILFDSAHNADGIAALVRHLQDQEPSTPKALIFGALADKDALGMLEQLAPHFPHRVYLAPKGRAPTPTAQLAARHPGHEVVAIDAALTKARQLAGDEGLIVVCGSIYLVGEVRSRFLGVPIDPVVAL